MVSAPIKTKTDLAFQRCISPDCGATYDVGDVRVSCGTCGELLDVSYNWDDLQPPVAMSFFESKWSRRFDPLCHSGVWRFRELLPFAPPEKIVTVGEGQ